MTIDELTDDQLDQLADKLAGRIAEKLQHKHRIWGSPDRLKVGSNVSLVNTQFNTVSGEIRIEDFAFFGHNCCVLTGTHQTDVFDFDRQANVPTEGRDIVIEQGAWICSCAIILGPCRVGRDAVIGVGSVVLQDVPSGWFYAGIPARPIRPVAPRYQRSSSDGAMLPTASGGDTPVP